MYGWLWRHLPGHWSLRVGELVVLAAGVVALLMYVVFPAADPHLPFNDVTVTTPSSPSPSPSVSPTASPTGTPTGTSTGSPSGPTPTTTGGILPGD